MPDRVDGATRARIPAPDGLAIVDKPAGMTSHDVVARFRRLARTRQVGHAGTLDPMATGVLVLAVGRATRLLSHLDLDGKTYSGRIRLGQQTSTDDAQGSVIAATSASAIHVEDIARAGAAFVGDIMQVPASVSAIKVDGERAYRRVRAGEPVALAARPVTISRFDIVAIELGGDVVDIDIEVDCSAGTYIRALARDLGRDLGVGGHLTMLRRLRVGRFGIDQARTLEQLGALENPTAFSMADAVRASMTVREISLSEVSELSYGRALVAVGHSGTCAALAPDGSVAALLREANGQARPIVVFVAR